jgi:ankyrin repeat domain-containing protein 50
LLAATDSSIFHRFPVASTLALPLSLAGVVMLAIYCRLDFAKGRQVSLGITVAQGLVDYYGAWKDCGDDIKSTLASLQDLSSILDILRSKLSLSQRLQGHEIQLEKTISSCTDPIIKLHNKLKKIQNNGKQSQFERLRYPFRRGTIGKLQDLITELRGNLQLLL